MLTEEMTDALLEIFEERWHAIITEYLSSMGDHLADIGELLPSDANRIIEMRRMGVTMERIRKQIAHAAQQSEEDVIRAMQAIAKSDAAFAERIFGSKLTASGRSALKRVLEAQARVTFGEMENLSRTTVLSDGYRKAVDKAVQAVQGGVSDYRSAIRRTVEEAAAEGLRVEYPTKTPSGRNRSMRLDSAVRMNVLDGVRAMNRAAMEQIGEEYGADGIEISAHALCATDHLPYQGLQYSKEEFEELQQSLGRPIGAWNCKHMTWPIILGVSECTYSKEELAEMNRFSTEEIEIDGRKKTRYEWSQEQRRIETAVRYQKDRANLARHSGHDDIRRDAQAKINKLTKAYEGISEKTKLGAEWDRMRVAGFRAVKTADQLKKSNDNVIIVNRGEAGTKRIIIDEKQLGRKCGKHMSEWGLDPSSAEDRKKFVEISRSICVNADEVRRVQWMPDKETGKRTVEVDAYVKGEDVVLASDNERYITTMRYGISNNRVKEGRKV